VYLVYEFTVNIYRPIVFAVIIQMAPVGYQYTTYKMYCTGMCYT